MWRGVDYKALSLACLCQCWSSKLSPVKLSIYKRKWIGNRWLSLHESWPLIGHASQLINLKINPWLHRLAVLSIGWLDDSSLFHSPLYLTLTNILPQSIFFGCWPLTFFFHCQFFPNPDLHTTHPPSNSTDLNLSLAYKLAINPLLTFAKLSSLLVWTYIFSWLNL
jgi:hypothetical protein